MPSEISDRKDAPKVQDVKTEGALSKKLGQTGIHSIQGKSSSDASTPSLNSLRQKAVRDAWKQESELVKATGSGTRDWNHREIRSLSKGDKLKGYHGHHIRSVNGHSPKWASDPRNIEFVTPSEHIKRHGDDFHNPTTGKLIDRQRLARMESKNRQPVRYLNSQQFQI